VSSVAFSCDGRFICSGSADQNVRLWDASTGAPLATLQGHMDCVNSVVFTPDRQSIVSCSYDKTIRIWDISRACAVPSGWVSNPNMALTSATLKNKWLKGPLGELLLWVPEEYRPYLWVPGSACTKVIGKHHIIVSIGDSGWHCGESWVSCWRGTT